MTAPDLGLLVLLVLLFLGVAPSALNNLQEGGRWGLLFLLVLGVLLAVVVARAS